MKRAQEAVTTSMHAIRSVTFHDGNHFSDAGSRGGELLQDAATVLLILNVCTYEQMFGVQMVMLILR